MIVVWAIEVSPGTDLRVWWLEAEDRGAAPRGAFAMASDDDLFNKRDEIGRGVAILGGEVVVVGERESVDEFNDVVRRTIVLRDSLGE